MNNLNIKSSTIEKGLELAKDFANKILGPTVEEVGLILADKVKFYRYKNQVNILLKAKKYVESKNIDPKEIPTKILVPLLEQASLEENEELQYKWANLIGNLADSEQNLQNQIFPYLLGQLSLNEYQELADLYRRETKFRMERAKVDKESKDFRETDGRFSSFPKELQVKQEKIEEIEQSGFSMPELEAFELANLERLGLIKSRPPQIVIDEFKTGSRYQEFGEVEEWHQIEAKYETLGFEGFRITELGELFIKLTNEK